MDSFYGAGAHETGHLVEVANLKEKICGSIILFGSKMDWRDCETAKKITSEAAKRAKKALKQLGIAGDNKCRFV